MFPSIQGVLGQLIFFGILSMSCEFIASVEV